MASWFVLPLQKWIIDLAMVSGKGWAPFAVEGVGIARDSELMCLGLLFYESVLSSVVSPRL